MFQPAQPHPAQPAHERVYQELRRQILHGEIAPGQAVTLRGLAEALSVSMTPAREALRRLIAERALSATETGRALAPVRSRAELAELLSARRLLEPELAARALPRADAALLRALNAADGRVNAALRAGDAAAYVRANAEFHGTLYAAAAAPALLALTQSVWLQLNPSMRVVNDRSGAGALVDQHEAALAALAAGDETALRAAVQGDILQAEAALLAA